MNVTTWVVMMSLTRACIPDHPVASGPAPIHASMS
jgi:hypothetical protein